nr:MAG TPA: hypothetical protein [Caudoviricetes sp.]
MNCCYIYYIVILLYCIECQNPHSFRVCVRGIF